MEMAAMISSLKFCNQQYHKAELTHDLQSSNLSQNDVKIQKTCQLTKACKLAFSSSKRIRPRSLD
jgi:hypothetical protein